MLLVKGQGSPLFACTALSFTIDFWEKTFYSYGCFFCRIFFTSGQEKTVNLFDLLFLCWFLLKNCFLQKLGFLVIPNVE